MEWNTDVIKKKYVKMYNIYYTYYIFFNCAIHNSFFFVFCMILGQILFTYNEDLNYSSKNLASGNYCYTEGQYCM